MTPPHGAGSYSGLYINLDRSQTRRRLFDEQLQRLSLADRYNRFPAVDGRAATIANSTLTPGENGAYLSHAGALDKMRGTGRAVHILEDDALLSSHVRPVIEQAVAANLFDRFDILFTDILVAPHLGMLKALKGLIAKLESPLTRSLGYSDLNTIDLAQQNFSCMTSYVVGPRSADRILAFYRADIASGLGRPVDLFIRDCVLAGKLRAACLFPFVTSFRLEDVVGNTIGRAEPAKRSVLALAALRYSFFVDRDLAYAMASLRSVTRNQRRPPDPHHEMIAEALEFVLSDDFVEF